MSKQVVVKEERLQSLIGTDSIKAKFNEMLGKKAPSFLSSVLSVVNGSKQLKECEPMSILASAAVAASMDLPVNPSLGFAHIVPYGQVAQFQMGWKGFVQLAMRSGQYKTINITEVFEGQIKDHNPFTGEMSFNAEAKSKDVVGYLLYFKLLNGYEKYFYMTKEQCLAHGKRYSKSFAKGFGVWKDDFNAMALKTVAKLGLSKYGVLSIDMQKAVEFDQATVDGGAIRYVDQVEDEGTEAPPEKPKTKSKRLNQAMGIREDEPQPPPAEPQEEVPEQDANEIPI